MRSYDVQYEWCSMQAQTLMQRAPRIPPDAFAAIGLFERFRVCRRSPGLVTASVEKVGDRRTILCKLREAAWLINKSTVSTSD